MKSRQRGLLEVDLCIDHGVWLDKGELRSLEKSFIRRSFLKTKAREAAAFERGRSYDGSFEQLFDWLSGFFSK